MNNDQIESLLVSALDLNGKPSPIKSVVVNDMTNSALVVFNSIEIAKTCLDLKEIVYFGKVLSILPGYEFQSQVYREETLYCEFKFQTLGEFLECVSRNRGKFEEVQGLATVKFPKLTLTVTAPSLTKVEEARRNMSSFFGVKSE